MYPFQQRKNSQLVNPDLSESIPLTNMSMKLTKSTKYEIENNNYPHRYKEPLDEIQNYNNYNPRDNKNSHLQRTEKASLKSSKFYIFEKSKPLETMVQVDLKNFKISEQRKITEKIKKIIKPTNSAIPSDESPVTNRREKIVLTRNDTNYKFKYVDLKMPSNNFHPSPKNKNKTINILNNDNKFSVISSIEVKHKKEKEKRNNKQYFIENEEEIKKIETSRNKHRKKKHSKKNENNQKIESNIKKEKAINDKKLKEIKIIKQENNNIEKSENASKKLDKKENVNKDIIPKNNDANKQKKPNIVINIIKNDITKKVIINNEIKEKVKNPTNVQNKKINKKEAIIDEDIDSDNKHKLKSINVSINPLKKPETEKKKKVYDITIDKIQGDINIEKKQPKEKNEKNKIQEMNTKEKLIKIQILNPNDKHNLSIIRNSQLTNIQKNETGNNISTKKSSDIYPKDKESKNKIKSVIQNITINNTIILNGKNNLRKSFDSNKINKNNIKKIKEIKEYKEIKDKKEKKNNKVDEQINFKFIKQIIQRYKDSPIKELIRENSDILLKNNKKSPEFIFNKIISSFENKKQLITSNNIKPVSQNIYSGYHFNPSDFKYLGVLGEGEYGKIYLVQWINNDNQLYAMKVEKYEYLEEINNIQNITQIIKDFEEKTNSSGIIKIYGDICLNDNNLYYYYTLMERCERDAEQECILRNKYQTYFTEQNLIDILCQLILTCSSLQKHNICHSDIKPQNILILNGIYKLTDFGEVKITNSKGIIQQEIRGTELYMSPKLFFAMKKKQSTVIHNPYKSDVFSLALCMLLLATFNYDSLVKIRELVDMTKITNIVNGFLSVRYSQNLIAFLMPMLEIDENKRPDFIDLENKLVKNN